MDKHNGHNPPVRWEVGEVSGGHFYLPDIEDHAAACDDEDEESVYLEHTRQLISYARVLLWTLRHGTHQQRTELLLKLEGIE